MTTADIGLALYIIGNFVIFGATFYYGWKI